MKLDHFSNPSGVFFFFKNFFPGFTKDLEKLRTRFSNMNGDSYIYELYV